MATEAEKSHAIATCDGVITITKREMLQQGVYVSHNICDPKLADEGAICGGRKACLVGSIFLANGHTYHEFMRAASGGSPYVGHLPSWFQTGRWEFMADKPSLSLAYDAFNEAAWEAIERDHAELDIEAEFPPIEGWAEYFFEVVLEDESQEVIQAEVIALANRAKTLIETGVVS